MAGLSCTTTYKTIVVERKRDFVKFKQFGIGLYQGGILPVGAPRKPLPVVTYSGEVFTIYRCKSY